MAKTKTVKTTTPATTKTKIPRVKTVAAKKTEELKEEVIELASDVEDKFKKELEEFIASKVEQAPEDSRLNKALRNAAIVCVLVVAAAIAWNIFA